VLIARIQHFQKRSIKGSFYDALLLQMRSLNHWH